MQHRHPTATYRLQFSGHLKLTDATALVDYLSALGVSDLYASPLFRARQESQHGYDVVDHNMIDPEIGSESDLEALAKTLVGQDMGLLMDVVPNHMGIDDVNNAWWQDVLEHGRSSPFARYFDIDWSPPKELSQDRVLLPVLGDQYGNVLERGEMQLVYERQRFRVQYAKRSLPIAARTWPGILKPALEQHLALPPDDPGRMELESIVASLAHLPSASEADAEIVRAGRREEEVARRRLAALVESHPQVSTAVATTIAAFNGRAGDPHSFDPLERLLEGQAYRLCYWRVAADEINYRRFFDINELAALRVEDPEVFAAAHAMVLHCLERGWVTGLRIDHPDGLLDPEQYLIDLQSAYRQLHPAAESNPLNAAPLYVVVEKILRSDEHLPTAWPTQGTTGYDFLSHVSGLFVDRRNAGRIKSVYAAFTDVQPRFAEIGYQSKRDVLATSMSSELHMLAGKLDRIAGQHRSSRDFTLASLRTVLGETIACFPVYRSYLRPGVRDVGDDDRRWIVAALRTAQRRNPGLSKSLFDFLGSLLLLENAPGLSDNQRADRREFVLRFQQLTGPVTAKGLEDTAAYRAFPLASLNEVGDDPAEFGTSVEQFHRQVAARAERWPHSLLATTTHDTKRSEDVRARIHVLSEIPEVWEQALHHWRSLNRRHKSQLDGSEAPDANEEYLFYQTVVGTWPHQKMTEDDHGRYVDRIVAYLLKAVREAKLHTSWLSPHEEYETAVEKFVRQTLDANPDNAFPADLAKFQQAIAIPGMYNSLGQTLLKIAAPGVADFYQGTELWDDSLVDPDNRRPVDFSVRQGLLQELQQWSELDLDGLVRDLIEHWPDGRIKLFVTWRGLQFRRRQARLFLEGRYLPLAVEGPRAEHICAFARADNDTWAIAVAPRWMTPLVSTGAIIPGPSAWEETRVLLPAEAPRDWRNLFTGDERRATWAASGAIPVADLLERFPVALWHSVA